MSAGVPIYDLRYGQCRYAVTPFEAKKHLFCAEPVEYPGCPYCAEHAAKCFDRRTDERKQFDAARSAIARAAAARAKAAAAEKGSFSSISPRAAFRDEASE